MAAHPEADFSLFIRAREGDQHSLERLWSFYEAYVKTTARSFYRTEYGVEFLEDLFAEARFRFCKAVAFYRPDNEKGVPFSRYCRTIVARALLDMRLAKQRDLDTLAKTDQLDLDELREVAYWQDFDQSDCLGQVLDGLSAADRDYALLLCTGRGWLASAKELGMTREEAQAALGRIRGEALTAGLGATD